MFLFHNWLVGIGFRLALATLLKTYWIAALEFLEFRVLQAQPMPIKISEREVKLLLEQALDYYVSYVIKNEFPHLTRDSYSEAAWLQMLINDGFRH